MIELNIGSLHIKIGREERPQNKINFLRPKHQEEIDAAHQVHEAIERLEAWKPEASAYGPHAHLLMGVDPGEPGGDSAAVVHGTRKPDGTVEIDRVEYAPVEEKNAHPNLRHARVLAAQHGWRELWHRKEEMRVRFKKGKDDIIDVWYTKMTVGTVLTHPKRGRGALFRKHVTNPLLGQIFKNPRIHTGEGYY